MDFKVTDIFSILKSINEMQQLKGSSFRFNFLLIEIKKRIQPIVEKTNGELKLLEDAQKELAKKYCKKDANNRPIVINGRYEGIHFGENVNFDTENKELEQEYRRLSNISLDEVDLGIIGIKSINKKDCPIDEMKGYHWEALQYWVNF